jgi:hypothetical protein
MRLGRSLAIASVVVLTAGIVFEIEPPFGGARSTRLLVSRPRGRLDSDFGLAVDL